MAARLHSRMSDITWPTVDEWLSLSRTTLVIMAVSGIVLFGFDVACSAGIGTLLGV